MKCSSPLGMESGRIPDLSIVASSRLDQYRGPERSRLNMTKNGNEDASKLTAMFVDNFVVSRNKKIPPEFEALLIRRMSAILGTFGNRSQPRLY